MRLLAQDDYPFTWILPGHGRMAKFSSVAEKNAAVLAAADNFDREDETQGMYSIGYF
jgi:glyoxylase-like metal-dependent hydrolase (beta-lactamase superfamily II)